MSKPNFKSIQPLDVPDEALQSVNEKLGVPTMVRPVKIKEPPAPRPCEKLTVMGPCMLPMKCVSRRSPSA